MPTSLQPATLWLVTSALLPLHLRQRQQQLARACHSRPQLPVRQQRPSQLQQLLWLEVSPLLL
jgi:hypothetical protein